MDKEGMQDNSLGHKDLSRWKVGRWLQALRPSTWGTAVPTQLPGLIRTHGHLHCPHHPNPGWRAEPPGTGRRDRDRASQGTGQHSEHLHSDLSSACPGEVTVRGLQTTLSVPSYIWEGRVPAGKQ